MKKFSILAAFLLVVVTVTFATAGPGRKGFDGSGHANPAVMEALDLTNEQMEKIQTLHESAKEKTIPVKVQLLMKRAEMKLLWTQPILDAVKIKATQKEIQVLRSQIREIKTDMRIAFRNLLTPEQTAQFLVMSCSKGDKRERGDRKNMGKRKDCREWVGNGGRCPGYGK